MIFTVETAFVLLAFILGGSAGYFIRLLLTMAKRGSIDIEIKQMILNAKEEVARITEEARTKAEEKEEELKELEKTKTDEWKKTEVRLVKKEEYLDARQIELDKEADHLKDQIEEIKTIKANVSELEAGKIKEIQKIAGLSKEEAKVILEKDIERDYAEDLMIRTRKLERENEEKLNRRAKEILTTTIHRLSSSTAQEHLTTVVNIPSEDIKGKIIGKEGRNIRSFERAAGVELIIDDTPGTIVISSFDPVRRQVARVALENLISDGRIQPAKIEEMLDSARDEINKIMKEEGERAVYECGIFNLDPRIVAIVGRLHFRTSYGQNVLQHSIEMVHIAGMLAEELGGDVAIAKAGALVHDIGKALDHEVQGTHIDIGIRILEKFGADPRIITAMKSHHDDCPHESIEAVIVQTADYISGGRPGARRDTVENYLKRLADLEGIINGFKGVERSYAISAGREVRVFVSPDDVSDIEAKHLARDIVRKIEQELKFPGEIKITVIRENRIIEFAR